MEKNFTEVVMPFHNFDLQAYLGEKSPDQKKSRYNLYAIISHEGLLLSSGHYKAYCKSASDETWYCYDDETVYPVTETIVETKSLSAYLLFYSRS